MSSTLDRLILVRPGATTVDRRHVLTGIEDPPLAPEGRRRMAELRRHWEWADRVVSSPLRRALESARILSGDTRIDLEPAFCAIDHGRWEGLRYDEIRARDPIAFEDWQRDPDSFSFPEGETTAGFQGRVAAGLARLEAGPERAVLVVTHQRVIQTLARLLSRPLPSDRPQMGELVLLTRRDGAWHLGRRSSDPEPLRSPLERDGLSGTGELVPEQHVAPLQVQVHQQG